MHINDLEGKPAREVKGGYTVALQQGPVSRTLVLCGISSQRGAAPVTQQRYEETAENLRLKAHAAEQPGARPPDQRDRRDMEKARDKAWDSRWSASAD